MAIAAAPGLTLPARTVTVARPLGVSDLFRRASGGDGLTALEEMRKIHQTLPIFLITSAYDHKYYFEKAQKLGASGFFPKKSSLEELLTIIEATVRLRAKKPGEG